MKKSLTRKWKSDLSKMLYQQYFSSNDRMIEITLKNKRKVTGILISFCLGDKYKREPYFRSWHIVKAKYKRTLGIDAFGFRIGEMINQKEIERVTFLDDNSVLIF